MSQAEPQSKRRRSGAGRPPIFPRVVEQLESLIADGRWNPGDRLESESQLGERFGVSRPLIRKALADLAQRGLVETVPGKGHFVADPADLRRDAGSILCLMGATHYSAIWDDAHVAQIAEGLEAAIGSSPHRLLFELTAMRHGGKGAVRAPIDSLRGVALVPLADQMVEPLIDTISKAVPCVVVGRPSLSPKYAAVTVDHYKATEQALSYLLQHGHRKIAFIGDIVDAWPMRQRYNAFQDVLTAAGSFNHCVCVGFPDDGLAARQQAASLLKNVVKTCTAVYVAAGALLGAVLHGLAELGVGVGRDISLMSYDDTETARINDPAITVIRQPTYQLGLIAGQMLIQQIDNRVDTLQPISLDCELLVRQSVCPI